MLVELELAAPIFPTPPICPVLICSSVLDVVDEEEGGGPVLYFELSNPPGPPSSPVRYAKFESIRYFIDIDILQNCLIDIDIDIDIFNFSISISISISIFFKSVDISTIDISYRYFNKEKE